MIKTLRFCDVKENSATSIPPGERMAFGDSPSVYFWPRKVTALVRHEGVLRELPVRELHVGHVVWAQDEMYRRFPVEDGVVQGDAHVFPGAKFRAVVENDLDVAVRPKVTVEGEGSMCGDSRRESYLSGLSPEPAGEVSRRLVLPEGFTLLTQEVGVSGQIRRITMRSDSEFDVDVSDIQVANVCLNVGTSLKPVEFFRGGWVVEKSFTVHPNLRISVGVRSTASKPRWVEIDVDLDVEEGVST